MSQSVLIRLVFKNGTTTIKRVKTLKSIVKIIKYLNPTEIYTTLSDGQEHLVYSQRPDQCHNVEKLKSN